MGVGASSTVGCVFERITMRYPLPTSHCPLCIADGVAEVEVVGGQEVEVEARERITAVGACQVVGDQGVGGEVRVEDGELDGGIATVERGGDAAWSEDAALRCPPRIGVVGADGVAQVVIVGTP